MSPGEKDWALITVAAVHESPVGTSRTNRAGLTMSVDRGQPEVAFRGRQDPF
jgi:hypothetical protein